MDAYTSKADNELVALLQSDDEGAFEEMYRRYATLLFRYVADKVRERENCEEIVQKPSFGYGRIVARFIMSRNYVHIYMASSSIKYSITSATT